jgi:serine/threonine-protein kinase
VRAVPDDQITPDQAGKVTRQDPAAGSEQPKGSTVTIDVGTQPDNGGSGNSGNPGGGAPGPGG